MTPALSFTGLVFGMHATAVKPPATAAAVPVATVSLCSCPGSRRCTCMSISPGHDDEAARHVDDADAGVDGRSRPTRAMRSPSIEHVEHAVAAVRRIDDAPAFQQPPGEVLDSWFRTQVLASRFWITVHEPSS